MQKSKLFFWSVINSLVIFAYILGAAWFLFNAGKLFGPANGFLGPATLLILSALITSALVLAGPIYLYLNGSKTAAVKLLVFTVAQAGLKIYFEFYDNDRPHSALNN